jgi:nitroreductase
VTIHHDAGNAVTPAVTSGREAERPVALHPLVGGRWSPRAFEPTPVAPETLTSLLEAARWAPSSANRQPWRLVVVTQDDPVHAATVAALAPTNQRWAGKAPVLIVTTAVVRNPDGSPNRYAWHDTGLATSQLILQAGALGLAAHIMGGYEPAALRAALSIPPEADPVAVVAVGRRADPGSLSEDLRLRETAPRTRLPLGSIAFRGKYGKPFEPA